MTLLKYKQTLLKDIKMGKGHQSIGKREGEYQKNRNGYKNNQDIKREMSQKQSTERGLHHKKDSRRGEADMDQKKKITVVGHCYNAVLAVKYLETRKILEAAQYASAAAGLQVMRPG